MNRSVRAVIGAVCGLACLPALAAPLAEPAQREQVQAQTPAAEAPEDPVDVQGWIQHETRSALLDATAEQDRNVLLRQGWQSRPPTWIQDSVQVNLADFPMLDRSTENAERDLKTLEWILEQQRRAAAGLARRETDEGPAGAPPDDGLRRLLPTHWIATLKANRGWVATGGTALLLIVWGTTIFARRPTNRPLPPPAPPVQPRPKRRRRRFRDAHPLTG
ncbi:MAG: hypothetical protein Fur0014_12480 [Rubrivivax sp.]